jgi:hypothetical protein
VKGEIDVQATLVVPRSGSIGRNGLLWIVTADGRLAP